MKLKLLLIPAILIIGLVIFLRLRSPSASNSSVSTSSQETSLPPTSTAAPLQSLRQLVASGQSQQCDFSFTENPTPVSGKIYLSAGKMRADFTVSSPSLPVNSHMLLDGNTYYMWTDGQSSGIKMPIPSVTAAPAAGTAAASLDLDKNYAYTCSSWTANPGFFTPPSGINFSSFTPTANCNLCASLSGTAAEQCLSAMNCPH